MRDETIRGICAIRGSKPKCCVPSCGFVLFVLFAVSAFRVASCPSWITLRSLLDI